jgi:hypothetical protein
MFARLQRHGHQLRLKSSTAPVSGSEMAAHLPGCLRAPRQASPSKQLLGLGDHEFVPWRGRDVMRLSGIVTETGMLFV